MFSTQITLSTKTTLKKGTTANNNDINFREKKASKVFAGTDDNMNILYTTLVNFGYINV